MEGHTNVLKEMIKVQLLNKKWKTKLLTKGLGGIDYYIIADNKRY